jgi:hypothetical protein
MISFSVGRALKKIFKTTLISKIITIKRNFLKINFGVILAINNIMITDRDNKDCKIMLPIRKVSIVRNKRNNNFEIGVNL